MGGLKMGAQKPTVERQPLTIHTLDNSAHLGISITIPSPIFKLVSALIRADKSILSLTNNVINKAKLRCACVVCASFLFFI
jgi:hypothetical protein